jgi:hypothetical protein
MKRYCIKRNKQKLTKAMQDSKRNNLCLSMWISIRNQLSLNKQIKRSLNKNGSTLDFERAEFDSSLQWLMVTELVKGISIKDCSIRVFQNPSELPAEFKAEFSSYWQQKSSPKLENCEEERIRSLNKLSALDQELGRMGYEL